MMMMTMMMMMMMMMSSLTSCGFPFFFKGKRLSKKILSLSWFPVGNWSFPEWPFKGSLPMFTWSLNILTEVYPGGAGCKGKSVRPLYMLDRCLFVLEKFLILFHSQLASRTLEVTLWSENKTKRNVFLGEVRTSTYTNKSQFISLLTIAFDEYKNYKVRCNSKELKIQVTRRVSKLLQYISKSKWLWATQLGKWIVSKQWQFWCHQLEVNPKVKLKLKPTGSVKK